MTNTPRFSCIPALLLTATIALGACTQREDVGAYPVDGDPPVNSAPIEGLDVLFVVDNSGSMAEEQASLVANFQILIDQLETTPGGLPSIHIGVVSTNLGAGGYNISGCDANGDDGAFHNTPSSASCFGPTGPFITDLTQEDGSRARNYSGTLAETFSCIARLGTSGCGYEQPLGAMRRALSSETGTGFVRENAHLAVVIITDEDDCSVFDNKLFDPSDIEVSDPLGALRSFRCVEFGTTCDGGPIARTPASYASCEPRAASPYLTHPDEFITYLTALKSDDETRFSVSVIAGERNGLEVAYNDEGIPGSTPSCSSESGTAYAGHRLGYLTDQIRHGLFTSICDPDLSGALRSTAALIGESIAGDDAEDPNGPDSATDAGCSAGHSGAATGVFALALLGCVTRRRRRKRFDR